MVAVRGENGKNGRKIVLLGLASLEEDIAATFQAPQKRDFVLQGVFFQLKVLSTKKLI